MHVALKELLVQQRLAQAHELPLAQLRRATKPGQQRVRAPHGWIAVRGALQRALQVLVDALLGVLDAHARQRRLLRLELLLEAAPVVGSQAP
eukprot:11211656-Lingulodinium_polyedra.AAC.1